MQSVLLTILRELIAAKTIATGFRVSLFIRNFAGMKEWIICICMGLAGCAATRPWAVPSDLTEGDPVKIVGEAANHNAMSELMRRAEETLLDSDEARMAEFLRAALQTGKLSDAEVATAEWMLHDVCERNAPGSPAADFSFVTSEQASEQTLHAFRRGEPLLVIFYDPDCDHCRKVIAELSDMSGLPTVLAVCIETSAKRWEQSRGALPESWIKAFDRSGILENDLYVIRTMPSIYLLDGDRNVILKNPQPCQLRK